MTVPITRRGFWYADPFALNQFIHGHAVCKRERREQNQCGEYREKAGQIKIDDDELNDDMYAAADYCAELVTVLARRAVAAALGETLE